MQINITGKNLKITPSLRAFINKKVAKIVNDFEHPVNCEVIISVEKLQHIAELVLHGDHGRFYFKKDSHDLYQAVESVVHSANVSIRKFKEKQKDRKIRSAKEIRAGVPPQPSAGQDRNFRLQRLNPGDIKPMTLEEAVLQLKFLKQDILIFNDAGTFQASVLIQDQSYFNLIAPRVPFLSRLLPGKEKKKIYYKFLLYSKNNRLKRVKRKKLTPETMTLESAVQNLLADKHRDYILFKIEPENKALILFRINKNYMGVYEI